MKRKRIWVVVSVLVVLGLLLGGFGCRAPTPEAPPPAAPPPEEAPPLEPVKLALLTWLAGPVKAMGERSIWSVELVIKQLNDAGGILGGRKIELMVYDQGFTTEDAAAATKKAIADGADVIHGGPAPALSRVIIGIVEEAGLPLITYAGGDEELLKIGYKGSLHGSPTEYPWHPPYLEWIEKQGWKTVVLINLDIEYTRIGNAIAFERWDKPGSPVKIVDDIWVSPAQVDLSVETAKAVASNPDLILCFIWGEAIVSLEKAAHELGYEGAIWIGGTQVAPENIEPAGEAAEGVYDFAVFFPDPTVPANKAYVDAFQEMWPGKIPASEGTYEYISIMAMMKAIDKAGTLTDLDKIYDAMMTVKWTTPMGEPLKIFPDGQVYFGKYTIIQVQGGKLVAIDKMDVDEALYHWWEREPEKIWWE